MTQTAVAEAAGLGDRMTIVRFERGHIWPDAQTQAKLEPIVGMPAGALEDIAARYETESSLIDRELTIEQAEALLNRQRRVREFYRRRVALLRRAVEEGRRDDALALADELDGLMSEPDDPQM